jgi:hypothetical protein
MPPQYADPIIQIIDSNKENVGRILTLLLTDSNARDG